MGIEEKDPLKPIRETIVIEGGRKLWTYSFPAENEEDDKEKAKPEPDPR